MGKIKYLLSRCIKMNYKAFFNTINKIHDRIKVSKLSIFLDIINCGIKYQAGYTDYDLFEMYRLNKMQRKTIVTRGKNNDILKKYNHKSKIYIFENKTIFNKIFKKYINTEWIKIENNYEAFKTFVQNKNEIIVKPTSLSCGKGIQKIKVNDYNLKELYKILVQNRQLLVEEVAKQHEKISKIYPYSVNTIRIVTINKKIITAYLRIGDLGNIVDNFNNGGLVTKVNIDSGIIEVPAVNKQGKVYYNHPYTNEKIIGVTIPMWEQAKKLCIDASSIIPEVGYIGWDVCIGLEKPFIIEGNCFPGHDIYQLPKHRKNGIGLLPEIEKVLEEK